MDVSYTIPPLVGNYEDSKKNGKGDLVSGIEYCKKIIVDKNASDDDKAFYLKLLIHLIGDLHQPMHIGLQKDKGGNDFKVQWFYEDSNLHRVWDTEMIESFNMSYNELAENADVLQWNPSKKSQTTRILSARDLFFLINNRRTRKNAMKIPIAKNMRGLIV